MSDDAGVIVDETGAQRLVGYTVDVGQPDRQARVRLVVEGSHTNRHGVLHGGIAGDPAGQRLRRDGQPDASMTPGGSRS